jgi:hypothetical protein
MRTTSKKDTPCDKCGGENDRAAYANYCTKCADAYNARVKKNRDELQKQSDDYWAKRPY